VPPPLICHWSRKTLFALRANRGSALPGHAIPRSRSAVSMLLWSCCQSLTNQEVFPMTHPAHPAWLSLRSLHCSTCSTRTLCSPECTVNVLKVHHKNKILANVLANPDFFLSLVPSSQTASPSDDDALLSFGAIWDMSQCMKPLQFSPFSPFSFATAPQTASPPHHDALLRPVTSCATPCDTPQEQTYMQTPLSSLLISSVTLSLTASASHHNAISSKVTKSDMSQCTRFLRSSHHFLPCELIHSSYVTTCSSITYEFVR
jgi:hypothetical protein